MKYRVWCFTVEWLADIYRNKNIYICAKDLNGAIKKFYKNHDGNRQSILKIRECKINEKVC